MTERNDITIHGLTGIVENLYDHLNNGNIPTMEVALRSKRNIEFNPKTSVWNYGDLKTLRTAKTVKGSLMLLRTVYIADFIKGMLETKKSSTLREMYYISEGWNNAKFNSQDESIILAEDLEILTGLMREDFKLRPEEDGARIYGDLTLTELTRKGEKKKINCIDDVGDSGYGIPYNVGPEKIEFKSCGAKFVIAIETGGMFDRLVENGFPEKYDALLVHLKGQPTRGTRRFMKRLNDELNLPVTVFTDGDPWSFRIYASVAYGAIKTAHISEYLATPSAQFIGITPSDILNYDLPTDTLTDKDKGALNAELSDPRFKDEFWENEIQAMLGMGKKAEQQALAKYGLDFVTDTYLPEKLTNMGIL